MSGSVKSGFNKVIDELYVENLYFANIHHDVVGNTNETSMQGPFTEQHVGGLQYRHVDLNGYNTEDGTIDSPQSRPEGWAILVTEHPVSDPSDSAFGIVGADYEAPYPSETLKKATRYRDEHAKRPVNIRNIKTVSGSWKVGNYTNEIQIFQLNAASQRYWAREAEANNSIDILPQRFTASLPSTTHYQTLMGFSPGEQGNVFGPNNNRQEPPDISTSATGTPHLAVHAPSTTTINRVWLQNTSISGYSATGYKSISFWYKQPDPLVAQSGNNFIVDIQTSSDLPVIRAHFDDAAEELIFNFYGTVGSAFVRYDISSYVGSWNSYVFVWDGVFNNAPTLYINGVEISPSTAWSGSGTANLRAMEKITLFDLNTGNDQYEAQAAMSHFGIWEGDLTNYVQDIYNQGAVREEPVLQGSLIDFWYLGKNQAGFSSGDTVPQGRIFSSSFGSAANHVQSYANDSTGLVFAEGPPTLITISNYENSNIIASPRTDLTGSERIINTRFSAPGGPEIQSIGYLDAYSSTYSVHNALPFRNLSVLGSGSGEAGTIRVEDHLGLRRGLKTLRTLHQGKFGIDSQYGTIIDGEYPSSGSFNKQHRNTQTRYAWNSDADVTASLSEPELITSNTYDNLHINSTLPRSEFQYSWIYSSISGSNWRDDQHIFGYAPKDGIISSSSGFVGAIVFPTGSTLYSDY